MHETLEQQFDQQHFAIGYELVNGVAMQVENGEQFQIPQCVDEGAIACVFREPMRVVSQQGLG